MDLVVARGGTVAWTILVRASGTDPLQHKQLFFSVTTSVSSLHVDAMPTEKPGAPS